MSLHLSAQNKVLFGSLIIFAALYLILKSKNNESTAQSSSEKKPLYADTLIPKGQVLIPIELANVEAVAGLIDQFGIIDLYSSVENNSLLVANRVKILRAPLNPNQYAVMVPESESREIMKIKGPFFAVVQNRFAKETPTAIETLQKSKPASSPLISKKKPNNNVEIEYYGE